MSRLTFSGGIYRPASLCRPFLESSFKVFDCLNWEPKLHSGVRSHPELATQRADHAGTIPRNLDRWVLHDGPRFLTGDHDALGPHIFDGLAEGSYRLDVHLKRRSVQVRP